MPSILLFFHHTNEGISLHLIIRLANQLRSNKNSNLVPGNFLQNFFLSPTVYHKQQKRTGRKGEGGKGKTEKILDNGEDFVVCCKKFFLGFKNQGNVLKFT